MTITRPNWATPTKHLLAQHGRLTTFMSAADTTRKKKKERKAFYVDCRSRDQVVGNTGFCDHPMAPGKGKERWEYCSGGKMRHIC